MAWHTRTLLILTIIALIFNQVSYSKPTPPTEDNKDPQTGEKRPGIPSKPESPAKKAKLVASKWKMEHTDDAWEASMRTSAFDGQITYKTVLNRAENHFLWFIQSGQTSHHPRKEDGTLNTEKCVSLMVAASYWPKVAFSASTKPMGKAIRDFKGIVNPNPDGMGEVKDSKCPLLKAALAGGVTDPHAEDNSWKILELKAGNTEKGQYADGTITAVFGTHARDWDPTQNCKKLLKGLGGRELLPCGDADGESSRRNPAYLQVSRKLNVHVKGTAVGSSASGNLPPVSGP